MKIIVVLLATVVALTSSAAVSNYDRSVYQFGKFITCLVDLGVFDGLEYNGYGCYCGYGGSGTALDETDRCCKEHDDCYGRALLDDVGCNTLEIYATTYDYEKYDDASGNCAIKCKAEEDYSWLALNPKCKAFMCECDRKGAQCFADRRGTFNMDYVSYDKNTC